MQASNAHWIRPVTAVLAAIWLLVAEPYRLLGQDVPGIPDEPEPPARLLPVEPVPDSLLEARMQAVFARIGPFQEIAVSVDDGVVTLTGVVPDAAARERALDLAEQFQGVIFVDDQMETALDIETRIAPAVGRVQEYLNRAFYMLPVIGVAIVVFLIFWLVGKLVTRWPPPTTRLRESPMMWNLVRRVVRALIVLMGLVLVFDILGISTMVGALLGTAGIIGIVLGFAFQEIAENYLAGVLLSIRQPFRINDIIRINEHEGRVVRMTSRELVLFTHEGNHVQLPNALVFKNTVINFTRNPRRRFEFDVGIAVEEDLTRAMRLGVETLQNMRGVMNDPRPFAWVMSLAESNVVVRYHGWVDQTTANFMVVRSEAIRLVKKALDEAGVDMPEPIYNLRISRSTEPRPPASVEEPPDADVDLQPDRDLDAQVLEDLARPDEENLLKKDGRPGP